MSMKYFNQGPKINSQYRLRIFDLYPSAIVNWHTSLQSLRLVFDADPKRVQDDLSLFLIHLFSHSFDLERNFQKSGVFFDEWLFLNAGDVIPVVVEGLSKSRPREALAALEKLEGAGPAFLLDEALYEKLNLGRDDRVLDCLYFLALELADSRVHLGQYYRSFISRVFQSRTYNSLKRNTIGDFDQHELFFLNKLLHDERSLSSYLEMNYELREKSFAPLMKKYMGYITERVRL